MKLLAKISGSLIALAVLTLAGFAFFLPDVCGNHVVSEAKSPDRARKVVVFQRDCGATTGFSTQASVLPTNSILPSGSGNLFASDTDHGAAPAGPGGGPAVIVEWEGVRAIALTHHPKVRVFKAEKKVESVHVRYIATP